VLWRRSPRRSSLSPSAGFRSSSGPPATIRTHVNLQCHLFSAFQGMAAVAHGADDPRWGDCSAVPKNGSTRCETESWSNRSRSS